jgi:Fungal specific transcription factor domain
MFVNVTHPSQIRDRALQRKVKAFTSAHNQRRRWYDRRQELQNEFALSFSPSSPNSTDEDSESTTSSARDPLCTVIRICEHNYEHDKVKQLQPEDSESEVEEIGRVSKASRKQDVVLLVDTQSDKILDLFPDTGNMAPPYSDAGLTPQVTARLRRLTQYYLDFEGPTLIWRPQQLVESSQFHLFRRNFFALSMTEPIILEVIFAISQRRLDLRINPNVEPTALVLQHRGKVLRMIQERLLDPKTMLDDATFFAIMGMIPLDAYCGNWISFKNNLDGFRALAALRGGAEKLGWQGWFQTILGWADLRWATYSKNKLTMLESPTYPEHPFAPHLSLSVSKLPVELREAALSKALSVEMLNLLHDVTKWTTSYDDKRKGQYYLEGLRLTTQGTGLMAKYEISPRERILCIGTIAYIIQTDGRKTEERAPRGLEEHLIGIEMLHSGLALDDGLLWAAVVIAASDDNPQGPSANQWVVLDRILDSDVDGQLRNWEHVRKRMRRLFWNNIIEESWEKCWKTAVERRNKEAENSEKGSLV